MEPNVSNAIIQMALKELTKEGIMLQRFITLHCKVLKTTKASLYSIFQVVCIKYIYDSYIVKNAEKSLLKFHLVYFISCNIINKYKIGILKPVSHSGSLHTYASVSLRKQRWYYNPTDQPTNIVFVLFQPRIISNNFVT